MIVAGAHQVCLRGVPREVCAIDTVNGKLSVDLLATVEGEERLLTRIHRNPTLQLNDWSLLQCAAPGRSCSVGPAVFCGLPPTRHVTKLV